MSHVLIGAMVSGILEIIWLQLRRSWIERGIIVPFNPIIGILLRVILSVIGTVFLTANGSAYVQIAAASAVDLGVLATMTDLASRKIPRDACWVVAAIGSALATLDGRFGALLLVAGTIFLALVISIYAARPFVRKGLGMGDVRLLIAFAASVGWWAGQINFLTGVIIASGIQFLFHLIKREWNGLPFAPALTVGMLATCVFAVTGI